MYLAVFDDKGNELTAFGRRSLFKVNFKLSPPIFDADAYTIINQDQIMFDPASKKSWAACLGVCQHADAVPFVIVPLEHGRMVRAGETLAIAPGQLALEVTNIRPKGRRKPEPDPRLKTNAQ
jgi:hypothetical protein